jgi:hypothetical protein
MEATSSATAVSPRQLADLLAALVPARKHALITGKPGIGKSRIVKQVGARLGYRVIVEHLGTRDQTDIGGQPMILDGKPEHVHFRIGRTIREATEPTIVFFDDIHNAPQAVQAAAMQWVLDIAGQVSPHVAFISACNAVGHRAGGSPIIETYKSRSIIVELESRLDDWTEWAMQSGIVPKVPAFLRFRPGLLHDFAPTANLTNSPCPRGWEAVSDMSKLGLPRNVQLAAYAGSVGEGAATEYLAFERIYDSITPPDLVFATPDRAPIPVELSALCAMALSLAHAVSPATMPALARYLERVQHQAPEAVALTLMSMRARNEPALLTCKGYTQDIACGPVGRVLIGTPRT